jgi:murein L,D-transpeptidase YcbB/YkuD
VIPGDCTLLRSACAATDRAARHGLVETATRWQEWCSLADRCEALVEPYSIARRGSCSDAAKARAALLELQCRAARELPALLADTGLEMLTGHAGASRWLSTELPRLIGDPSSAIDRMAPQFPAYQTLLAAGDRYRTADPPESVPDGLSRLRPGRTGNAVPWLRRRLSRDGIDAAPLDSTSFDRKLRKALEAFQQMHGLSPSGKVDRKTVEALSTPPEVTWRLLRTALAAWRRAVPPWESSFILVQVPQAFVELHLDSRLVLRMRAVVGSTGREKDPDTGIRELVYRTLPLNSAITAIVVNPDWRIPTTIVDREITPRLDGDPDYLERRNIRVEQFESGAVRYIQEPGDRNAMGRLKFRFPNRHGFYLHDSPDKRLFRRAYRLYSHGCIRVEHAAKLAERLLARDKGWNFDQLRKTLRRGETREVPLTTPIPIHVIYSTAAADSDGNLYFFPDWYGLEEGVSAE